MIVVRSVSTKKKGPNCSEKSETQTHTQTNRATNRVADKAAASSIDIDKRVWRASCAIHYPKQEEEVVVVVAQSRRRRLLWLLMRFRLLSR